MSQALFLWERPRWPDDHARSKGKPFSRLDEKADESLGPVEEEAFPVSAAMPSRALPGSPFPYEKAGCVGGGSSATARWKPFSRLDEKEPAESSSAPGKEVVDAYPMAPHLGKASLLAQTIDAPARGRSNFPQGRPPKTASYKCGVCLGCAAWISTWCSWVLAVLFVVVVITGIVVIFLDWDDVDVLVHSQLMHNLSGLSSETGWR